tara:strand:+ start:1065 stop:1832 length:768 start_codon:yes stop_codon:yes gene_type:complete
MSKIPTILQYDISTDEIISYDDDVKDEVQVKQEYDDDDDDDADDINDELLEMTAINKKKSVNKKDIFKMPEAIPEPDDVLEDEIKEEIKELSEPTPEPTPEKKPPRLTKRGKVRKPISEEHKRKLQEGRLKGLETRRKNAEIKRIAKEEEDEEKQSLNLLKKKKSQVKSKLIKKELEEVEDELEEQLPKSKRMITFEDLQMIQKNTIEHIENDRLKRKQIKKKDREEKQYQDNILKKINPVPWHKDPNNPYRGYF